MNMDKVASVDVNQSILGRILDYGTVQVIGAGGAQNAPNSTVVRGIEDLRLARFQAVRGEYGLRRALGDSGKAGVAVGQPHMRCL